MTPVWKKFDAIESLRGWMAWWVVLQHSLYFVGGGREYLGYTLAKWIGKGDSAVQVFMIVSGFVICHMMLGKPETYRSYITRRWFRLVPMYFIVLAVAILSSSLYEVYITNPWVPDKVMRVERLAAEQSNWLPHILLHLTLLHGLIPNEILKYAPVTFVAPAWSLSLEWQFYLVAPFLVRAMRGASRWPLYIMLALSAVTLSGRVGTWENNSFLPLGIAFFFAGIASRIALDRQIPWQASAATVVALLIYLFKNHSADNITQVVLVLSIWAAFLLITARELGLIKIRSVALDRASWLVAYNPVVVAFGRVSYSTYLAHIPILAIVVGGGIRLTGNTSHLWVMSLSAIGVSCAWISAFALYRFVEMPGMRLGKKYAASRVNDELAAA